MHFMLKYETPPLVVFHTSKGTWNGFDQGGYQQGCVPNDPKQPRFIRQIWEFV